MKYIAIYAIFLLQASIAFASNQDPDTFKYAQRFDSSGRLVGTIAPDPDGAGPLGFPATRTTYKTGGSQLQKEEVGYLSQWMDDRVLPKKWNSTVFKVVKSKQYHYDNRGRKTVELDIGGDGVVFSRTEFNYDSAGRVKCMAERMSPERFRYTYVSSQVCIARQHESFGYDRIKKFEYDAYGNVVKEHRAVDTPLEQVYKLTKYQAGVKLDYLEDANGNRTEFRYDALGRNSYIYYPSKTTSGEISASDYERFYFDKNGNVTKKRTRSGKSVFYTYDALNRECRKSYSTSSSSCLAAGDASTVLSRYDTQGMKVHARFKSHSGNGIIYSYDGLGRHVGETNSTMGISRKISYRLDNHGNRTRITHPDGKYFSYKYDFLDRVTGIGEYASVSSLQSVSYNNNGMLASISRSGGPITKITPKSSLRIHSVQHDLSGSSNDYKSSFSYNPPGGITQIDLSNDLYHYFGNENKEGSYSPNGLNQYAEIGGKSLIYDGNGNLSTIDGRVHTYDAENKLVKMAGSETASFSYDPLGRLSRIVSKEGSFDFIYSDDKPVLFYHTSGSKSVARRFVFGSGADELVASYTGPYVNSGNRRHLLRDYLGSVIAETDSKGVVKERFSYDTYGMPKAGMGLRFGFTGQLWLGDEVGLYSYKARKYEPKIGRFLQTDKLGYLDNMNLYSYVSGNPVLYTDPSGLCRLKPGAKVCDASEDPEEVVIVRGDSSTGETSCGGGCSSMSGPSAERYHRELQNARDQAGGGLVFNPTNWTRGWEAYLSGDQVAMRAQSESNRQAMIASTAVMVTPVLMVEAPFSTSIGVGTYLFMDQTPTPSEYIKSLLVSRIIGVPMNKLGQASGSVVGRRIWDINANSISVGVDSAIQYQ